MQSDKEPLNAMRRAWAMTKQRCTNPRCRDYKYYGGRGVQLADRWMEFENFLADMGPRPDGMTLDRIDNSGNYEPGNCRWATRQVQSENTRKTKHITWNGRTQTLSAWARETGIAPSTLKARLNVLNYTVETALTKDVKCGGKDPSAHYRKRRRTDPEKIRTGQAHPNTKLGVNTVIECRRRWSAGESFSALARGFGVTVTTMSNACQALGSYKDTGEG